jgi:hypothetical protein
VDQQVVPAVALPPDDVVHLGAVRRRLADRAELLDRCLGVRRRPRGEGTRVGPLQLEPEARVQTVRVRRRRAGEASQGVTARRRWTPSGRDAVLGLLEQQPLWAVD